MQTNIRTMIINARATDRARTTTVPRWDEPLTAKEVHPVGKDERSKSSSKAMGEGGGEFVLSVLLRSLFAVGRHGAFGEKRGEISADMEKGVGDKGFTFTHGTVNRAVK